MWDWPGEVPAETADEDEGTETTRTPRRAGVSVNESADCLAIDDMLLRRFAETVGLPVATEVMLLILAGNSNDWMAPPPLPADDDVLLTAWTRSIVFCPDELLPAGRLDSTRLPLDTDTIRLLVLVRGNCLLTSDDDDGAGEAEITVQQYFTFYCMFLFVFVCF